MSPWYVLPVLPQRELSIEGRLRAMGIGAMAPWYEGHKYVRGNPREWRRPLYVGYVFVALADHDADWQHINATLNTTERKIAFPLLGGDDPAELRPAEVAHLQSIADGRYIDVAATISIGDRVIVPDGPLEGRSSRVIGIRKTKKRGKMATLRVLGEKNDIDLERPLAILVKT